MEGEMDDMENAENEDNAMDDDDEDGDENGHKNEYVKKEFVARPWTSDTLDETLAEVDAFTIKNSR